MERPLDRVLLVGINAYPDAPLQGCVNDVENAGTFLNLAHYVSRADIVTLIDKEATAASIRDGLAWLSDPSVPAVRRILWYSGHGAHLSEGDDASDCVCPIDFDWSRERAITVDDFHQAFTRVPLGGCVQWVSDSCHSGGLLRDLRGPGRNIKAFPHGGSPAPRRDRCSVRTFERSIIRLPHVALISGCRTDQTSADASFYGQPAGALSNALFEVARKPHNANASLRSLVRQVREMLVAQHFEQVPQLVGTDDQVDRVFADRSAGACIVEAR